ncbi:hypothetical protein EsDP_00003048 [Epichloe bromicola]|uniref:Uncharacterized protein n=1 Tax=Epichloe bromicola TaxID=79588 RepID=A0ABQ0CMK2_9HYPO
MCGPEVTSRPRGGALAALSAPRNDSLCHLSLQGDLAFHTPGQPGSAEATHARFTPSERGGLTLGDVDSLRVIIHLTGDMTKAAGDCGLFRQFTIANAVPSSSYVELPLDSPLSLEVGDGGIIGRRVSISSTTDSGPEVLLAEGIVGFNFLEQRPPLCDPRRDEAGEATAN